MHELHTKLKYIIVNMKSLIQKSDERLIKSTHLLLPYVSLNHVSVFCQITIYSNTKKNILALNIKSLIQENDERLIKSTHLLLPYISLNHVPVFCKITIY